MVMNLKIICLTSLKVFHVLMNTLMQRKLWIVGKLLQKTVKLHKYLSRETSTSHNEINLRKDYISNCSVLKDYKILLSIFFTWQKNI